MIRKAHSFLHTHAFPLNLASNFGSYKGNIRKSVQGALKPDSKIIVDPGYFKKTGLISRLINKFKTSNTLSDAKRHFHNFSENGFQMEALHSYHKL